MGAGAEITFVAGAEASSVVPPMCGAVDAA
jgi:hypothetical protein